MTQRKLYLGPLTDNRHWDRVVIRSDDVIVVTPPKCGTTWMQTIIALLFSGDPEVETELSIRMPWVDIRLRDLEEVVERLEGMTHRRSMKSHTPMDGLPLDDHAQYICVFRHPLDAHLSNCRHMHNMPITFYSHWFPEDDPDGVAFRRFLDGGAEGFDMDAAPLAHILRHYKAAIALADRPNVTLFHFADMRRDLEATFAKVAELLDISHSAETMAQLVRAATFDNMRANAERFAPSGGKGFFKSDRAFFHSGSNGQWADVVSGDQIARYDAMMAESLTPEERAWLEYGSAGVPSG